MFVGSSTSVERGDCGGDRVHRRWSLHSTAGPCVTTGRPNRVPPIAARAPAGATLAAGWFIHLPVGVPHAFRITGDTPPANDGYPALTGNPWPPRSPAGTTSAPATDSASSDHPSPPSPPARASPTRSATAAIQPEASVRRSNARTVVGRLEAMTLVEVLACDRQTGLPERRADRQNREPGDGPGRFECAPHRACVRTASAIVDLGGSGPEALVGRATTVRAEASRSPGRRPPRTRCRWSRWPRSL